MTDYPGQAVMNFSPATRTSHPETSKIAEENITKSGKRKTHCDKVLKLLRQNNGSTTKELAAVEGNKLTHAQIWRRMNDLVENGFIKRNERITREGHCTWWIL